MTLLAHWPGTFDVEEEDDDDDDGVDDDDDYCLRDDY